MQILCHFGWYKGSISSKYNIYAAAKLRKSLCPSFRYFRYDVLYTVCILYMNKTVKKNNALLTNVSFISVTIHSVCHVEIKVSKYGLYITLRYNHVYVCNNDVDHHAFFNYMPIFILYILYTVESVLHVSRFCKDSYQQTTEISKKSICQGPSNRLSCVD